MGIQHWVSGFSTERETLLKKREEEVSRLTSQFGEKWNFIPHGGGNSLKGNSGDNKELFRLIYKPEPTKEVPNPEPQTVGYEFLWVNKTGFILQGGKIFPGYTFYKFLRVPLNRVEFVRETSFNRKEWGGVGNYNSPHMVEVETSEQKKEREERELLTKLNEEKERELREMEKRELEELRKEKELLILQLREKENSVPTSEPSSPEPSSPRRGNRKN